MKTLCLIRNDRAGDALKTLPALRTLTVKDSRWEVHIIVSRFNQSLFEFEPNVTVHVAPTPLTNEFTNSLPHFDAAAILPCDPSPYAEEILNKISAGRKVSLWATASDRLSHSHIGSDERLNIAQICAFATQEHLDWNTYSMLPVLSGNDRDEANSYFSKLPSQSHFIAICPFASEERRSLPDNKIIAVANSVLHTVPKSFIIFPGLEKDRDHFSLIASRTVAPERFSIATPTSFRALGAYLSKCTALIGVDSGPLHLAISLGTPVLGFLAGCDKARWYPAPPSSHQFIHRGIFDKFPTTMGIKLTVGRWLKTRYTAKDV